jgi:hypothetical protein
MKKTIYVITALLSYPTINLNMQKSSMQNSLVDFSNKQINPKELNEVSQNFYNSLLDNAKNDIIKNNLFIKEAQTTCFYNVFQIKAMNGDKILKGAILNEYQAERKRLDSFLEELKNNKTQFNTLNLNNEYRTSRTLLEDKVKSWFTLYEATNNNKLTKLSEDKVKNELNESKSQELENEITTLKQTINEAINNKDYTFLKENTFYQAISIFADLKYLNYINELFNRLKKNGSERIKYLIELNFNYHTSENKEIIHFKDYSIIINQKLKNALSMHTFNIFDTLDDTIKDELTNLMHALTMPRILFEDIEETKLDSYFKFLNDSFINKKIDYLYFNNDNNLNINNKSKFDEVMVFLNTNNFSAEEIKDPKTLFDVNLMLFIKNNISQLNENFNIDCFPLLYLVLKYTMEFKVDEEGKIDLFRYQDTKMGKKDHEDLISIKTSIFNFAFLILKISKERMLTIIKDSLLLEKEDLKEFILKGGYQLKMHKEVINEIETMLSYALNNKESENEKFKNTIYNFKKENNTNDIEQKVLTKFNEIFTKIDELEKKKIDELEKENLENYQLLAQSTILISSEENQK